MKPSNKGVDLAKDDQWSKINETFEESQADLSVSTFIHHYWLSRYEYTTEKKVYKALRKQIKKDNAAGFLDDLVLETGLYPFPSPLTESGKGRIGNPGFVGCNEPVSDKAAVTNGLGSNTSPRGRSTQNQARAKRADGD